MLGDALERRRLGALDPEVLAAVVEQRHRVRLGVGHRVDPADEQLVVARLNVSTTVHSSVAIAPSMSGRPVGPGVQAAPQKGSRPGSTGAPAKQSDRACWSSDRTLTAYRPASLTDGVMNRRRSSATMTSGGSRLTDDSALTVIPAAAVVERRHDGDAGHEVAHHPAERVRGDLGGERARAWPRV